MRESYRDKRNRQARIAREKEENKTKPRFVERREGERRKEDRRMSERRFGERRTNQRDGVDRRVSERRSDERRGEDRRNKQIYIDNINQEYEDIVAGRNSVIELLKSGKDINKIFVERGEKHGSINEIVATGTGREHTYFYRTDCPSGESNAL